MFFKGGTLEELEKLREVFHRDLQQAEDEGCDYALNGFRWLLGMLEEEYLRMVIENIERKEDEGRDTDNLKQIPTETIPDPNT